jgi:ABC-type transport system involved in cytochrome bd biosynthesis fused ATPase/permease subunit
MTNFVYTDHPTEHAAMERAQNAAANLRQVASHFEGARGAATLLLAAVVSALMVVANQVIDTWSEGHLLAAWMMLWLVAFAGLALLTGPARRAGAALRSTFSHWAKSRRQAAEDQHTLQVAMSDPRIMAELNHALGIASLTDIRKFS